MTTKSQQRQRPREVAVERVQTGLRLEKRLLKVNKALADSLDLTLGDLVEGVLLHALEGKAPFSASTLARAAQLREVFGLDLRAADAHHLTERPAAHAGRKP
jgi:predicted DNA-binding ribbon-helix-helix protein